MMQLEVNTGWFTVEHLLILSKKFTIVINKDLSRVAGSWNFSESNHNKVDCEKFAKSSSAVYASLTNSFAKTTSKNLGLLNYSFSEQRLKNVSESRISP